MGKAVVLTEEQKIQIEALAGYLNSKQIADFLNVSRTTFFEILKRDGDARRRYRAGRANKLQLVSGYLEESMKSGNVSSIIFYLKTQGGWNENMSLLEEDEAVAVPNSVEVIIRDARTKEDGG